MKIKDLKSAISDLPDDMQVLVETSHNIFDWHDLTASNIETERVDDTFYITAKINDDEDNGLNQ